MKLTLLVPSLLSIGFLFAQPAYSATGGVDVFMAKKCPDGTQWNGEKKKCIQAPRGSHN